MARTNKKVEKSEIEELDTLKPIDFKVIGSKFDPCFGKGYDLTTQECKRCGDNETCCIAFMQSGLADERKVMEDKHKFKDVAANFKSEATQDDIRKNSGTSLSDMELKEVTKYFKKHIRKEMPRPKSIRLAAKRFGHDKKELRAIYKSIQDG